MDLTDEERHFLGFHLACQLEDYGKMIKKECKDAKSREAATAQWRRLEQLIYTKFIPESWCGPKPSYWK
jgi:hypothetical protein